MRKSQYEMRDRLNAWIGRAAHARVTASVMRAYSTQAATNAPSLRTKIAALI